MNDQELIAIENAYSVFRQHHASWRRGYQYPYVTSRTLASELCIVRSRWRVIGFTPLAFELLREHIEKSLPKVTRAHLRQRADTVREMLQGPELTQRQFINRILGTADHCVLAVRGENNKSIGGRTDLISFPNEGDDPLFQERSLKPRWREAEWKFVGKFNEN
ncbi:MAG: hypothetical protein HOM58_11915 [Rhodospirillaceae bacterium]|nr:hypothetical protein [Rhodospirillaceae bacterium]